MIYIAICDDQIHQIERIKKCIENMNLKEVNIYTFTDEKEMISFCKNKNRNFIFYLSRTSQQQLFPLHQMHLHRTESPYMNTLCVQDRFLTETKKYQYQFYYSTESCQPA